MVLGHPKTLQYTDINLFRPTPTMSSSSLELSTLFSQHPKSDQSGSFFAPEKFRSAYAGGFGYEELSIEDMVRASEYESKDSTFAAISIDDVKKGINSLRDLSSTDQASVISQLTYEKIILNTVDSKRMARSVVSRLKRYTQGRRHDHGDPIWKTDDFKKALLKLEKQIEGTGYDILKGDKQSPETIAQIEELATAINQRNLVTTLYDQHKNCLEWQAQEDRSHAEASAARLKPQTDKEHNEAALKRRQFREEENARHEREAKSS